MLNRSEILQKFLDDKHADGNIISLKYFWALFGINRADNARAQFKFLGCMDRLKDDLLHKHEADLQNVWSKGYMLVPWQERIDRAVEDTKKGTRKMLRKGRARLTYIPHPEQLNYEKQRERDAALQAFEMARRLLSTQRRYPE